MTDFRELVDLASERLGGTALAANDEFFAGRENLLKPGAPVFREGEYTDSGKWMDGWETRRRREPGHDWCVIRLGLPGILRGAVVDTRHFVGNFPPECSLDRAEVEGDPDAAPLTGASNTWVEVLPRAPLEGDRENLFPLHGSHRSTHVRLNIYPDGGVARLRLFGEVLPDWQGLVRAGGEVDLACVANGGLVVASSDMFFGSRHNLILPDRPRDMSDGWETRRRRGPGHDWAIVRLGRTGSIRRVEVDTAHFKGNAPGSCSIDVAKAGPAADPAAPGLTWKELLPRTPLLPHTLHRFEGELADAGEATHARLNIFPDGGVSRLRLFARMRS
ncbi:MAG TPA: allantoicase [Thermoanaerobaculia bacterium]|nr:allantoicase [Thermoanaerobaculia bacterium]